MSDQVLDIGAAQIVCRSTLEGNSTTLGEYLSTVLFDPDFDVQVLRRMEVGSEVHLEKGSVITMKLIIGREL